MGASNRDGMIIGKNEAPFLVAFASSHPFSSLSLRVSCWLDVLGFQSRAKPVAPRYIRNNFREITFEPGDPRLVSPRSVARHGAARYLVARRRNSAISEFRTGRVAGPETPEPVQVCTRQRKYSLFQGSPSGLGQYRGRKIDRFPGINERANIDGRFALDRDFGAISFRGGLGRAKICSREIVFPGVLVEMFDGDLRFCYTC